MTGRGGAVHLYDEINPQEIARILKHHLGDFDVFVDAISRAYLAH